MNVYLFIQKVNPFLEPVLINKAAGFLRLLNRSMLDYNLDKLPTEDKVYIVCSSKDVELLRDSYKQQSNIFVQEKTEIAPDNDILLIKSGQFPSWNLSENTESSFVLNSHYEKNQLASLFLKKSDIKNEYISAFLKEDIDFLNANLKQVLSSVPGIKYSWDILNLQEYILQNVSFERLGEIEEGATLKGNVHVGKNTLIKSGAYIEGPVYISENCNIGPNCYIRGNTFIGNTSKVGNAVEIKNCYVGNAVNVNHLSYLGDSIVCDNSNVAAGNISSNLRHDHKEITTVLHGEKIKTGRNKLGVIIGEQVHTGINNSFYPGRKIWPNKQTSPGAIVQKDIK